MRIKVKDSVKVLTGKYKGRIGEVEKVDRERRMVTVKGVNEVNRHVKRSKMNMQGGRISKNMPIPSANVMVVCPKCQKPSRLGVKLNEAGKKMRLCKECGVIFE